MPRSIPKSLLALSLAAAMAPMVVWAQKKQSAPAARPAAPGNRPNAPAERPNAPADRPNRPHPMMPDTAVGRWNAMRPQEREKLMSKLPPEQQKRLRDKIEAFNRLPKQEQQRQLSIYERFSKLPPAQKQAIRRDAQEFHNLPPERRRAINQELGRLTRMSDDQRAEYFASDRFHKNFSPGEQEMLQNLARITPTEK